MVTPKDESPAAEETTVDRTAAPPLATAAERATLERTLEVDGDDGTDAGDAADKTDMNAVGDDGQVFGG
jgi:hypothetical protein